MNKKQTTAYFYINPVYLFLIILGSIFVAETLVMFILAALPPLSVIKEAFVDATLLSFILLPVIYFLIYKPFRQHIIERNKLDKERDRFHNALSEYNKELEQIVYVTSHDLRSPLVNIDGYNKIIGSSLRDIVSILDSTKTSEEVKEKVSSIVDTDIQEAEHYISTNILKMQGLLAGLIHLSRIGKIEVQKENVDMNKMIIDVKESMAYQINELGVKVGISELPSCIGDESQLNQVFSNLLSNALKYIDSTRPGSINISGNIENEHIVYCVEDNGIGIKSEHKEKIFEMFHQLNPIMGGEGLGLSIVQKIIERHNGKIWVESEIDTGSKFFVSLPLA